MATIKLLIDSNTNNVARTRSKVGFVITNTSITGNIVAEPIIDEIVGCEPGLIFTCEDNSQYIPLI